MPSTNRIKVLMLFSAWIVASAFFVQRAVAQSGVLNWSEPQQIWGYEDEAESPFLVADQNRTVHALNSRNIQNDNSFGGIDITYRRWNPDQGWLEPIDVILSPKKNIARIRGVMLDTQGYLHVVFYGGDEQDASIYYTYAHATEADSAAAWAKPKEIAPFAGPVNDGLMIGDGDQRLFVIFTGNADGMGAYSTFSLDGGLNWTEPEPIHLSAPGQWPTHYGLYFDDENQLHVAWSEGDATGNGLLLYYARLDENTSGWTQPSILARKEDTDYEVDWPAFISYDGELLLTYQDSSVAAKWMQRSRNGGQTWTSPERLFPAYIGETGAMRFALDSANTLHLITGNRTPRGSTNIHGLWHSTWENGNWRDLEPVVTGPRVISPVGEDGFDPTMPQIVISQGNTLLLTWKTDPGAGRNGVRYTFSRLNTPELPVVALEPLPVQAPVSATPVSTALLPTPTPLPAAIMEAPMAVSTSATISRTLMIASLPVFLLLIVILLVFQRRRRKIN